jgi:hypothetical protein
MVIASEAKQSQCLKYMNPITCVEIATPARCSATARKRVAFGSSQ